MPWDSLSSYLFSAYCVLCARHVLALGTPWGMTPRGSWEPPSPGRAGGTSTGHGAGGGGAVGRGSVQPRVDVCWVWELQPPPAARPRAFAFSQCLQGWQMYLTRSYVVSAAQPSAFKLLHHLPYRCVAFIITVVMGMRKTSSYMQCFTSSLSYLRISTLRCSIRFMCM